MYKIFSKTVNDIPFHPETILETPSVQISVKAFVKKQGFEVVKGEQRPFYIPFTGRSFKQRVDVIGIRDEDVLIVECKGAPLDKIGLCSAILQLSIYLRLYKMSVLTPNHQLFFIRS